MLLFGALAGAFSQASANPATNKLIAEDLPEGERGVITGIRQSGVQFGIFLGGVSVPSLAVALGWRGAYLVVAAIPLVFALVAIWAIPSGPASERSHRERNRGRLPTAIWWLAGYGFLSGFSGAVVYFVPLYAEETLGWSVFVGGIAAAVVAFVAVPGRILWSRHAEQSGAFRQSLAVMAGLRRRCRVRRRVELGRGVVALAGSGADRRRVEFVDLGWNAGRDGRSRLGWQPAERPGLCCSASSPVSVLAPRSSGALIHATESYSTRCGCSRRLSPRWAPGP